MIVAALMYVVMGLLLSLSVALPVYDPLPSNMYDLVTSLTTFVYSFDYILPIGTMFQILLIGLYIQMIVLGIDILLFILKQARLIKM